MKILLVDADSHNNFPNLVLMKLSAWHKQKGDQIDIIHGIPTTKPLEPYDKAYISCIFFQNKDAILDYANQLDFSYEIGGSGVGYENKLHDPIEHIMPDYSLYNIDYSLGFTSRGCIRKCSFCIVPKKEGYICDNASITEFLDPTHKKLILLDNNFQASPKWRENLTFIQDEKLKVNFNQGLDIRLMDKEFAQALAETKTYNRTFKTKSFHIALDDLRYLKPFIKGVSILHNAGISPKQIMVYILCGFNTTHQEDLLRIEAVKEVGAIPYIMMYNQSVDPWVRHLARWINGRFYQFLPMEVYNNGVLIL